MSDSANALWGPEAEYGFRAVIADGDNPNWRDDPYGGHLRAWSGCYSNEGATNPDDLAGTMAGDIPINIGGRGEYVEFSFSGQSSEGRFIAG